MYPNSLILSTCLCLFGFSCRLGNSWGIWDENTGVSMDFCFCLQGCADEEELTPPFSGVTAREGWETKQNVGFGATNGNPLGSALGKGSFQGLPAQLGWGYLIPNPSPASLGTELRAARQDHPYCSHFKPGLTSRFLGLGNRESQEQGHSSIREIWESGSQDSGRFGNWDDLGTEGLRNQGDLEIGRVRNQRNLGTGEIWE